MLILMKLLDAITLLFLSMITAGGIVMDCHLFLPSHYYLKLMIDDYIREKRQYLLLEMPEFYKALLYYHLLVNWPLAVISLYGFTFRRFWFSTTTLILSVSFASISVNYPPAHTVFFKIRKLSDVYTLLSTETRTFDLFT